MDPATADALAEEQSKDPDAMLRLLTIEELHGGQAAGNPVQQALAAGISTGVGAIIPVIPFIWLLGDTGVIVAGIVGTRLLVGVDVPETVAGVSTRDLPTLLFGLGAIFLAREPRGVLFNLVNRLRLRQAQREARHDEPAEPAPPAVGVPA